MKFKRQQYLIKNPVMKTSFTKKELGKSMTIPGQSMSLKDIIQRSISGFPVPMQREEMVLHPDLNQVLQGTKHDIVSDAKFRKMSKVERERYVNNIRGLKQQLSEKVDKAIKEKEAVQAELLSNAQQQLIEQNTTDPTPST